MRTPACHTEWHGGRSSAPPRPHRAVGGGRPRTFELDDGLLRRHLPPCFARVPLDRDHPRGGTSLARRPDRLRAGAVDGCQGLPAAQDHPQHRSRRRAAGTNPCVLRGAGSEKTPERRPPTLADAEALATAIRPRWRLLVLLATWSGLRWGELAGLTRRRVDLLHRTITVVEQLVESDAGVFLGPPKTDAGRRVVHLPPHVLPELETHLDQWVGAAPDAWLFCGPKGAPLVRRNFAHHWSAARRAAGVPGVHFHDLRHLAATIAVVRRVASHATPGSIRRIA